MAKCLSTFFFVHPLEDVAYIKELRDVLKAKYAKVESKWESLSEEVEDPFEDQEEP